MKVKINLKKNGFELLNELADYKNKGKKKKKKTKEINLRPGWDIVNVGNTSYQIRIPDQDVRQALNLNNGALDDNWSQDAVQALRELNDERRMLQERIVRQQNEFSESIVQVPIIENYIHPELSAESQTTLQQLGTELNNMFDNDDNSDDEGYF